jgi:hypothetical protein
MTWFGKHWGAPVCDENDQAPRPDDPCAACGERFAEDTQGLILPLVGTPDDPPTVAFHLACFAASLGLSSGDPDA